MLIRRNGDDDVSIGVMEPVSCNTSLAWLWMFHLGLRSDDLVTTQCKEVGRRTVDSGLGELLHHLHHHQYFQNEAPQANLTPSQHLDSFKYHSAASLFDNQ
jgi:hypothetical protein